MRTLRGPFLASRIGDDTLPPTPPRGAGTHRNVLNLHTRGRFTSVSHHTPHTTTHGDRQTDRQRQRKEDRKREREEEMQDERQEKGRRKTRRKTREDKIESIKRSRDRDEMCCVWLCGFDFSCFFRSKLPDSRTISNFQNYHDQP